MLKLLFDFTDLQAVNAWHAIDDRVMGGISQSRLKHDLASHAVFEGEVSLEQNGGFASVRSKPGDRGHPGAHACLLEMRGDNKQFKLSLLTGDGLDGVNYQVTFTPEGSAWQTLRLPLAEFSQGPARCEPLASASNQAFAALSCQPVCGGPRSLTYGLSLTAAGCCG